MRVSLVFSLKFQSQLRRTRPLVCELLEKAVLNSAKVFGANTRQALRCIIADFDETSMGFWLDMLSCIETIHKAISKVSGELYGYICVVSKFQDEEAVPFLLRSMLSEGKTSGIWCSDSIKKALENFIVFGENQKDLHIENAQQSFTEIEAIKEADAGQVYDPWREGLNAAMSATASSALNPLNTVLLGKSFRGKRASLRRYCVERPDFFIPLTICFGSGGFGISSIVNAYNTELREIFEQTRDEAKEEMDSMYNFLSAFRFQQENSAHTLRKALDFFSLLLGAYCGAAASAKRRPVLILENIESAGVNSINIIGGVYNAQKAKHPVLLCATCSSPSLPAEFSQLFSRVVSCDNAVRQEIRPAEISSSLLEMAYACMLLGKYFPPFSFMELLEERGKNKRGLRRTFELMLQNRLITSVENPFVEAEDYREEIEAALGERRGYIRSLVKGILMSRFESGKIVACYNLLEVLHEFGGQISDTLAIEAVHSDITGGVHLPIENSVKNDVFASVVGEERAGALINYYRALKSLMFSEEAEIIEVFHSLKQIEFCVPAYKPRLLAVEASYKIGMYNTNAAFKAIRESIVISKDGGAKSKTAHSYRLFSLVNLSKKEINDAIDYISFAVDNSEIAKDSHEFVVSTYYAAVIQFIYGNISKSERLIKQAGKTARASGEEEWALCSKFFLGRLHFESGNYKNALAVFKSLSEEKNCAKPELFLATVNAWIFRTELYLYQCMPDKPEVLNSDGRLFELEALYLTGNYAKAVKLADHFLHNLPKEKFLFLEQPDWESGFSHCEFIEFSQKKFWSRICAIWRLLSMCRLQSLPEDSIDAMNDILSEERFNDCDPNAPFYFFANYRVLSELKHNEFDKNTAISIAFKRLKNRAGRIDNIDSRRSFLANQYWNKILFNTAKEYKLI